MPLLKNFFFYTVLALLILLACASYYRFIVIDDYLVSYEAACATETESCFIGCDDDACSSEYYYSLIERPASEVFALCGENVLECEAANFCEGGSGTCTVTYCDPEMDGENACAVISNDL